MSTQEFKPGDRVRCVDAGGIGSGLMEGQVYTIADVTDDGGDGFVWILGHGATLLDASRFEPASEPEDADDVEPEPLKEGDWVQVWAQVSQADPDQEGDIHLWAGEKREYSGFYLKPDSPGIIRTESTPPWAKVENAEAKAISAIRTALVVEGGMHDDRYTQQTAESLYRAGIRATKDGAS